jgi:GT2 family glycosyltransferase
VTPRVSVVIVTYRSRAVLPACLESLRDCAQQVPLEIVVVDNASADGTPEWLMATWPQVRVIANPDNRGFTRGVNQGVAAAGGSTLLILNPDCRVAPGDLTRLLAALEADPNLAAVAPMLVDDHGHPARSCGRFPSLISLVCEHLGFARAFPGSPVFDAYKYGGRPLSRLGRVDWCSGAVLLVPRHAWLKLGGFDERIFMYMEEVDWCRRARRAGMVVRFVPEARVVHTGQHASRHVPEAIYLYNLRSRVYYFRKHHGRLAASAAKAILATSLVGKWLATRLGLSRAGEPRVYVRGLEVVWAA